MSAREAMLAAIRAALADVPGDEAASFDPAAAGGDPAAAYRRIDGDEPDGAVPARFAQRCGDYRATVTRCAETPEAIGVAVGQACARHRVSSVVTAPGVPGEWLPAGVSVLADDPPRGVAELDGAGAALTGCALAIADTGTIVLDADPVCGRRALTLVPDVHVCVVRAAQIVAGVPEAVGAMADASRAGRAVTLVSGPSATSDIELKRVEGVHGPRTLEVVLAG